MLLNATHFDLGHPTGVHAFSMTSVLFASVRGSTQGDRNDAEQLSLTAGHRWIPLEEMGPLAANGSEGNVCERTSRRLDEHRA